MEYLTQAFLRFLPDEDRNVKLLTHLEQRALNVNILDENKTVK